jgi:dolichyl-phosphate-mannose--protein O-mannosyl transferase
MYHHSESGYMAAVTPIPNPIVTWLGVAVILFLVLVGLRQVAIASRARSFAPLTNHTMFVVAFVLTGYLSGLVPWVILSSRSAVYQFYAVGLTPFAALAIAVVAAEIAAARSSARPLQLTAISFDASPSARLGRRVTVAMVVAAAAVLALLFWPLWSALPVPEWFYRLHLWLPGWA